MFFGNFGPYDTAPYRGLVESEGTRRGYDVFRNGLIYALDGDGMLARSIFAASACMQHVKSTTYHTSHMGHRRCCSLYATRQVD